MKLTKSILRTMIGEQIKEITTSARGSGATLKRGQASQTTSDAKAAQDAAKDAQTAAATAATDADRAVVTHTAQEPKYTHGSGRLAQQRSAKYRRPAGGKGSYEYVDIPTRGFTSNPDWTGWDGTRTTLDRAASDARTTSTSAQSDYSDATDTWQASVASDIKMRKGTRPATAKGGARTTRGARSGGLSRGQVASVMRAVQSKLAKLSGMEPTDPKGEKDSDEEE